MEVGNHLKLAGRRKGLATPCNTHHHAVTRTKRCLMMSQSSATMRSSFPLSIPLCDFRNNLLVMYCGTTIAVAWVIDISRIYKKASYLAQSDPKAEAATARDWQLKGSNPPNSFAQVSVHTDFTALLTATCALSQLLSCLRQLASLQHEVHSMLERDSPFLRLNLNQEERKSTLQSQSKSALQNISIQKQKVISPFLRA